MGPRPRFGGPPARPARAVSARQRGINVGRTASRGERTTRHLAPRVAARHHRRPHRPSGPSSGKGATGGTTEGDRFLSRRLGHFSKMPETVPRDAIGDVY